MKKKKRIILISCSTLLLVIIGSVLFIRFGGYLIIDKSEKEHLVNEIKNAPQLPDRFYEIYDMVYPNALEKSTFLSYFYKGRQNNQKCPCGEAAYFGMYGKYFGIKLRLLSFILDDYVTQKECLNFYTTKIDFLHGNIGMENFSESYFNKDIYSLNDKEIVEIIIIMKNPSLYSRKRNPERLDLEINRILEEINK